MIMTNKLLPVALIAALIGGSVGALVMHRSQPATAETTTSTGAQVAGATTTQSDAALPADFNTSEEQIAYKTGFADGFTAADGRAVSTNNVQTSRSAAPTRVVYRNRTTARRGSSASASRVYYDYNRPQSRSFWSKHRDKLTMAIGTGAGAAIGGLIGGKKGAAIGAVSGLGGSALYTYKLRNRNRSN
jgi:hypothetical protein